MRKEMRHFLEGERTEWFFKGLDNGAPDIVTAFRNIAGSPYMLIIEGSTVRMKLGGRIVSFDIPQLAEAMADAIATDEDLPMENFDALIAKLRADVHQDEAAEAKMNCYLTVRDFRAEEDAETETGLPAGAEMPGLVPVDA